MLRCLAVCLRLGTLPGLLVGSHLCGFRALSFGIFPRQGGLAFVFLSFLEFAAEGHHACILGPNGRFTRHRDHGLLARLLFLITLRLLESSVGLLKTFGSIMVRARDASQLHRVLSLVELKGVFLADLYWYKTVSFTLHRVRPTWQEFVTGIDRLNHSPRIGPDYVLHNHGVARLGHSIVRFRGYDHAEGLDIAGRFDPAAGASAVVIQRQL